MTFPLSSCTTHISGPSRFQIVEFEPLLDAAEAAALLRMHPNTLWMKARLGEIPGGHILGVIPVSAPVMRIDRFFSARL